MAEIKKSSINKNKLINRRMFILTVGKFVVFTGIIGRLFALQISEGSKYKTLSDKNRLREWKLAPQRGVIEDYFENKIADNSQVFQLHMIPEEVINFNELYFRLQKIIKLDKKKIISLKKKIKRQKPWESIIISENLSWSEFSRINLFLHEFSGIDTVVSVARKYPSNDSFSHLVGYVSSASREDLKNNERIRNIHVPGLKVGKTGLEKLLDNDLLGSAGYQRYEVNAYGKRIKEIKVVEGKIGKSYRTTLDTEIQKFINTLLVDLSASVCVMDIYTGDIISMVSSPSFNPNKFVHGISQKEWLQLLNNQKKPLINKCISGLYPPGSTIKPIVALSALEHDVINPKFLVECKGHIELYGTKYHCWKKKGHGYMRLRNAIKQSCDIYFYEVARRLGVDRLSITSKKFGLGKKVLFNFPEEKNGIVPDTKWKLKQLGRGWVLGETLITGIGQGYIQSTPLQLCLMTAQIANGGYQIKPKIIDDGSSLRQTNIMNNYLSNKESFTEIIKNNLSILSLYRNPENVKFVKEAMFGSVNEVRGTGYQSRIENKKYQFAGKTGTSQVKKITEKEREEEIKNEDRPYKERDHALFTAFAPYINPRYAVTVVIEHGGTGSSVAAPIAKQVIKKVLDRHSLRELQMKKFSKEI